MGKRSEQQAEKYLDLRSIVSSWPAVIIASILFSPIWAIFFGYTSGGMVSLEDLSRSILAEKNAWLIPFGHLASIRHDVYHDISALFGTFLLQSVFIFVFFAAPLAAILLVFKDIIIQRRLSRTNGKVVVFLIISYILISVFLPND